MELPIGKDLIDLCGLFPVGKPSMEMLDVQVRTRFRRRRPGKTQRFRLDPSRAFRSLRHTGERFIVELESGKPSCQLEKALIVARTVGIEIGDLKTAPVTQPHRTTTLVSCRPSVMVDDNHLLRK